jgi:3-methyladenine DNA glycosylase AlkD
MADGVEAALAALRRKGTRHDLDNLARFGIAATDPIGVSMANLKVIAREIGRDHELALALWETGIYEARMLATLIDEPARVGAAQMEAWCKDFDNWGIVDTACFALFDRTPGAWRKVTAWSARRGEFQKRAAFALLWGLTVHDKAAADAKFVAGLRLIEKAANDERHFVKKAVSMALRATGKRNAKLRVAAIEVARRLAGSQEPGARWIGKEALRDLKA